MVGLGGREFAGKEKVEEGHFLISSLIDTGLDKEYILQVHYTIEKTKAPPP